MPALRARGEAMLIHTGQHTDPELVEAHFDDLGLDEPDLRLETKAKKRAPRLGAMVKELGTRFQKLNPRRVVVFGDTDSTLAAALAASFCDLPLAHVEAGARSGERDLPEERNRILTDELSDLMLCSTEAHARNLFGRSNVYTVGDLMVDVLFKHKKEIFARAAKAEGDYAVLTLHRAATADDSEAVRRVLKGAASLRMPVIFLAHPRTRRNIKQTPSNVKVRAPLPYLDFLGLVAGARLVLTDSGGLQKEAYLLGVPCITLREATEWEETVAAGWNLLAGTDPRRILAAARERPRMEIRPHIYGDGNAAKNIVARL